MRIGIVANLSKPHVNSLLPELVEWLTAHKQEVYFFDNGFSYSGITSCKNSDEFLSVVEMVLAIGGDGTLLKASHIIGEKGIPILGINLGGLGFLTEVRKDELYPALTKVLSSGYKTEERMVLEAIVKEEKLYGLNDIVIVGSGSGRMLQLELWINGSYTSNFLADGLIVSTPTGSTAYSLAALGPVVEPSMECIVVNLICPHTFGARPIVVSADSVIEVKCSAPSIVVVADGQKKISLSNNETVKFKKADYKVKLVQSGFRDFYEVLRTKLKWGGGKER
ncbi:MAG: NAD(+)/NADH kinase [bacterium]|nr:NAD(+)/NADH kinase [bacterium]